MRLMNKELKSRKSELSLEFDEKERFCVKSACRWILCCNDFLLPLSLTVASKPPSAPRAGSQPSERGVPYPQAKGSSSQPV